MTREACEIKMDPSWLNQLKEEFEAPYMQELRNFLAQEIKTGKTIYPHGDFIFEAFNKTPFDRVKVVILGQDPYHGPGQAHGMCFSVRPKIKPPPSLINIYKEIESDLKIPRPDHGHLETWAKQGVFLLNTVLTVQKAQAGSHRNRGWENFTDQVIKTLSAKKENLVFLLWGSPAGQKEKLLDSTKHLILKAPHPSPLSAHRGFLGCRHFSKANEFLKSKGLTPIDWSIPTHKTQPQATT